MSSSGLVIFAEKLTDWLTAGVAGLEVIEPSFGF